MVATNQAAWGFYGRRDEIWQLREILRRQRFFFVKISGRRRIGKTSLIQQVLQGEQRDKVLYIAVPDSDPAGVVATARDFFESFKVAMPPPTDLKSLASAIGALVRGGYVVVLDEFQYFLRKTLYEFSSHLQAEVDRLTAEADRMSGGLIVLGSIHTEMSALLEDRTAPLFNRTTNVLELGHLDVASVLEILHIHADGSPHRLLFLWNLFEGVPKFYRDCYEQDALDQDRAEVLRRMFFSSAAPLRTEAENWFLRELRGRYDLVIKYIARHPGCTNGELTDHARSIEPDGEKQVGGYLANLRDRYQMVEQLRPVFSKATAKNSRYYIRDNFLRAWLAALATPAASITFRPVAEVLAEADARLADAEGHGLERLVATLYDERGRKGVGDFPLSERIQGYWDKGQTEIDLVAFNTERRILRLGTCKRSAERLPEDLTTFEGHVQRFLDGVPRFNGWTVEKVAIATEHTPATRAAVEKRGFQAQDLADLTRGL